MPNYKNQLSKAFNVQSTFFIPVWRRILVVAASAAWALFELVMGNPGWAVFFIAIAIYCAHQFFVVFDPIDKEK
jgi:hypothetical protein